MFGSNRQFQAGLNVKDARRQREQNSLSLRRKDREQRLQNKRKKILSKRTNNNSSNITTNQEELDQQRLLQQLPRFVSGCFTEHKATIFECTQQIRKLLSFSHNAPIGQVIESGIVPRLIQFLRWNDCPQLQFEALWIITNIASSDKAEYTAHIVRNGAIPAFIDILSIPNYALQEQCVWALGNIAGDCIEIRNMVLEHNLLIHIIKLCQEPYDSNRKRAEFVSLMENLSWAVANLCRYGSHSKPQLTQLLECLYHLLQQGQSTCYADIGWSFCYLLGRIDDNDNECYVLNVMHSNKTGITKKLISLLSTSPTQAQRSILRAVGNIVTANDRYTAKCVEYDVLFHLRQLLLDSQSQPQSQCNDRMVKEICWAISNITAGTESQIRAVMKQNIFPILVNILSSGRDLVATEALWAISNATTSFSKTDIIEHLVQLGVIKALCAFLKRKFGPNNEHIWNVTWEKLLFVSLESIQNILNVDGNDDKYATEFEINGGWDFLEYLQSDDTISQLAYDKVGDLVTFLNQPVANIKSRSVKEKESEKFDFGFDNNRCGFTF
eukprot:47118_1